MSRIDYGGHTSQSAPFIFIASLLVLGAVFIWLRWGDYKVSKMLAAYPDRPRTVDPYGVSLNTHLKSQLVKATNRVAELTAQVAPEGRETRRALKERWEKQRGHLTDRIQELEIQVQEKYDQLRDTVEHDEDDRAFVENLAKGGES